MKDVIGGGSLGLAGWPPPRPRKAKQRKRESGANEVTRRSELDGNYLPPSSSGLGHSPLTAKTGVRVPLGVVCTLE